MFTPSLTVRIGTKTTWDVANAHWILGLKSNSPDLASYKSIRWWTTSYSCFNFELWYPKVVAPVGQHVLRMIRESLFHDGKQKFQISVDLLSMTILREIGNRLRCKRNMPYILWNFNKPRDQWLWHFMKNSRKFIKLRYMLRGAQFTLFC